MLGVWPGTEAPGQQRQIMGQQAPRVGRARAIGDERLQQVGRLLIRPLRRRIIFRGVQLIGPVGQHIGQRDSIFDDRGELLDELFLNRVRPTQRLGRLIGLAGLSMRQRQLIERCGIDVGVCRHVRKIARQLARQRDRPLERRGGFVVTSLLSQRQRQIVTVTGQHETILAIPAVGLGHFLRQRDRPPVELLRFGRTVSLG